jgi:hypothetical protein
VGHAGHRYTSNPVSRNNQERAVTGKRGDGCYDLDSTSGRSGWHGRGDRRTCRIDGESGRNTAEHDAGCAGQIGAKNLDRCALVTIEISIRICP